jgi:DASH complex subunit SPC19
MERREKALISKSELQEGRLQQKPHVSRGAVGRPGSRAGNNANAERLKMLKSKKERLAHTIERLELQAGHKVWIVRVKVLVWR